MVQELRPMDALLKDLGLITNIHMVVYTVCNSSYREPNVLFWSLKEVDIHLVHSIHVDKTPAHIKN